MIVGDTAECSTNEQPPFHGETAAEQRACAIHELTTDDPTTSLTGSIDGGPPIEIHRHRYQVVSPQTHTVFVGMSGQNPVTAGPGTLVSAGYQALVKGLSVGQHTLPSKSVAPMGTDHQTLKVTVTR